MVTLLAHDVRVANGPIQLAQALDLRAKERHSVCEGIAIGHDL
jgi:hypothetical protein